MYTTEQTVTFTHRLRPAFWSTKDQTYGFMLILLPGIISWLMWTNYLPKNL